MGIWGSKPEPEKVYIERKVYVPIEPKKPKTPERWRKTPDYSDDLEKTADKLMEELRMHKDTRLNIVLIGHAGAGKSSLINSIFSISRGRIVNKTVTKAYNLEGFGTHYFTEIKSREADLFQRIRFYDTMGYTTTFGENKTGISLEDLKAVCEGRVAVGHKFNTASALPEPIKEKKPHCVIFVVSAEEIKSLKPDSETDIKENLESLYKVVPEDVARIAVMTKIDRVCDDTHRDIKYAFSSEKIRTLVKQVQALFGVQENEVFPIVNYVTELGLDKRKNVPILFALKFALNYAYDRNEEDKDDPDDD